MHVHNVRILHVICFIVCYADITRVCVYFFKLLKAKDREKIFQAAGGKLHRQKWRSLLGGGRAGVEARRGVNRNISLVCGGWGGSNGKRLRLLLGLKYQGKEFIPSVQEPLGFKAPLRALILKNSLEFCPASCAPIEVMMWWSSFFPLLS